MDELDASAELEAFRRSAHALVDGVADHLAALPSRPVWQPLPDALRERLLELPLPEHGASLDDLMVIALRDVLPYAMGNGHPGFFGWVNPPPSAAGVAASFVAAAMNPSVVAGDHADVHLERSVVRWLAELVGFPHEPGGGLLTSGGSAATIVCLAGARGRALSAAGHDVRRDGLAGAPPLVAYVPAEAHSCVRRALELLGLGSGALREIPLNAGRLDAAVLQTAIAADRASGAVPALLVDDVVAVKASSDRQSSVLDQLTLAALIESGAYDRHIRRSRLAYRRRRDRLVAALHRDAPGVRVTGVAAGLHAVVRLPPGRREDEVVAGAAARGLAVEGLGAFAAAESREDPALIVGYGAPAEHAFTAAVARLTAALAE